jgi:hypothetical protein
MLAKPISIMVHVEGSGTAAVTSVTAIVASALVSLAIRGRLFHAQYYASRERKKPREGGFSVSSRVIVDQAASNASFDFRR